MATTLPFLGSGVSQIAPVGDAVRDGSGPGARPGSGAREGMFAQALERAGQPTPEEASGEAVNAAGGVQRAGEQARAREALELGVARPVEKVETGDAILGGMQKMRGLFDARYSDISAVTRANLTGTEMMIGMQKELVHYSLLIDLASKLTGKLTQTVDQLMKGQ